MSFVAELLFAACVLATVAEAGYAHVRRLALYGRGELVADLGCAAAGFGVLALHRASYFALYSWVYTQFGARWAIWSSPFGWLIAFLAYDVIYYVDHRSTHTFDLLWTSHRVHHQTRAFNLLTGLRMSVVGPLLGYPFRLPLSLLGVSPELYLSVDLIHALLTYFSHARYVGKLGPLEWFLNTPAHHRVHHSVAPAHFGKNYGGVFLFWDRLLGTYHPPVDVSEFGDGRSEEPLGPWRAHYTALRDYLHQDPNARR